MLKSFRLSFGSLLIIARKSQGPIFNSLLSTKPALVFRGEAGTKVTRNVLQLTTTSLHGREDNIGEGILALRNTVRFVVVKTLLQGITEYSIDLVFVGAVTGSRSAGVSEFHLVVLRPF